MTLLHCRDVSAGYFGVPVIAGVTLEIARGECVALLGKNGVGKTTLANAISGGGQALGGAVHFDGRDVTAWAAYQRTRAGLVLAPDYRGVFRQLTIRENLAVVKGRDAAIPTLLLRRANQLAAKLSGGEQQLLALTCALAMAPKLLIVDELSEGLSVKTLSEVIALLQARIRDGMALMLIEQRVEVVMTIATRCYIFDFVGGRGGVAREVLAATLNTDEMMAPSR